MITDNVKLLKEITSDWNCDFAMPCHTYAISKDSNKDNGKCVGYIKEGSTDIIWFKKAMKFDGRFRKFKELPYKKGDIL